MARLTEDDLKLLEGGFPTKTRQESSGLLTEEDLALISPKRGPMVLRQPPISGPQEDERVEEPGVLSEFAGGVGRGIESDKALLTAAGGQLAGAVGLEGLNESAMQTYDEIMAEANSRPAAIGRVEDITNAGDFALWAANAFGEQVPMIAGVLASGGAGALVRMGIAKGVGEAVTKAALKRAAVAGGFAFSGGLGTGEVAGELREVGENNPGLSLLFGSAIGALDVLPIMGVAAKWGVGPKFTQEFMKNLVGMNRWKQAGVMGALIGTGEAGTEALQEVLSMTARKIVDENFEILGEEGQSRLLNAAAGGLLIGGGLGGGVSFVSPMRGEGVSGGLEDLATELDIEEAPPRRKPKAQPTTPSPEDGKILAESVAEAKRVKNPTAEAGRTEIEPTLDPFEDVERDAPTPDVVDAPRLDAKEVAATSVKPLTMEEELKVEMEAMEAERTPLTPDSREGIVVQPEAITLPADAAYEATVEAKVVSEEEKTTAQLQLEAKSEKIKAAKARGKELTLREKERLARLRTKAESEEKLTKREQQALAKLNLKEEELAIKAGDAKPVIGYYAEDDRANLYGPFESPKAADVWSEVLQKRSGAMRTEIESLTEYKEYLSDNFSFKEVEDAEAIAEAQGDNLQKIKEKIDGPVVKASRVEEADKAPLRTQEDVDNWGKRVAEIVDEFQAIYKGAPKINTLALKIVDIRRAEMVPVDVYSSIGPKQEYSLPVDFASKLRASHGIHADYSKGGMANIVYLNIRQARTERQVWKTLLHEVLVHEGLRRGLTEQERLGLLKLIDRDLSLEAVGAQYRLDMGDMKNRLVAAEEYMARLAENPSQNPTLWRQIVVKLRRIFRRWFPQLRMSDDELRVMIMDMDVAFRVRVFNKGRYRGLLGAFAPKAWAREQARLKKNLEGSIFVEKGEPQMLWAQREEGREGRIFIDPDNPLRRPELSVPVYVKVVKPLEATTPEGLKTFRELQDRSEDLWEQATVPWTEMEKAGYDSIIEAGEVRLPPGSVEKNVWQALDKPIPFSFDRPTLFEPAIHNVATVMQSVAEKGEGEFGPDGLQYLVEQEKLANIWKLKAMKFFLTPLQIAQRIPIDTVQRYLKHVEEFWNTKTALLIEPEEVIRTWRLMGKEKANQLSKALFEVNDESDRLKRRLLRAELAGIFQKNNLDEAQIALYHRIDNSLRNLLPKLEKGMVRAALREAVGSRPDQALLDTVFATRTQGAELMEDMAKLVGTKDNKHVALALRMDEIRDQMKNLSERNYFPHKRFGMYSLAVVANQDTKIDGKVYRKNRLIAWETTETRKDQTSRGEELRRAYGSVARVKLGKIEDTEFALLGFPPQMLEAMKQELGLSLQQRKVLEEIYIRTSPGKAFLRSLTRRKGVKGYSEDAMRVYASHMQSASNNIARMEHRTDLLDELSVMRTMSKGQDPETKADLGTMDNTGIGEMRDYFSDHYQYLMNPGNDLAKLRALGFLWYLGAVPKSAFVNMTQVPMVTYPWLAARFGDRASVSAIAKSYKDVSRFMLGKVDALDALTQDMIKKGMEEGWIDESLATELAGIAESPALLRALPGDTGHAMLNKVSYFGSFLFHQAEKYNRKVSAVAAFRLEMQKSGNVERANEMAKASVQSTQFEYAKWNRASFMRGKKSVFFLFWQYMQHASFLAFGGEGKGTAIRMWAMFLVMAGMQGLPFAENAMDLFDFIATKFKGLLGYGDPRTDVREDIRKLVKELGGNPDMAMHGLSRYYGLGPFHVLEALGMPVPNVDVSGSLSMGRVIPGIEDMTGHERDPDKRLARMVVEMGGPVVGMGYNFFRLAFDQHPDSWKAWERAMPSTVKNASKAMRWAVTGEERLSSGAAIYDFEDMPSRAAEIGQKLAQAAGFAPSELTKAYEIRSAQEGVRRYYLTRRALLLQNLGYATIINDREGMKDARDAIRNFNRDVPAGALRIDRETIKNSLRARKRGVRLEELGLPREKSLRRLHREVAESF